MTDPDPRIEAVAKAVYDREAASATPWARLASQAADEWRAEAIPLLAAADAVDPLRHTDDGWELAWVRATPGERRTDSIDETTGGMVHKLADVQPDVWLMPGDVEAA